MDKKSAPSLSRAEAFKIVIVGILLLMAVLQVIVYEFNAISSLDSSQKSAPSDLFIYQGANEKDSVTFDNKKLLPEKIAYSFSDEFSGVVSNSNESVSELYEGIEPLISAVFSSDAECVKLGDVAGRTLWHGACESNEYVYIKYHGEFPFPLIYAYANEEKNVLISSVASGDMPKIGDMFIKLCRGSDAEIQSGLEDHVGKFYAIGHTEDGKYSLFISQKGDGDIDFSKSAFETYTDFADASAIKFVEKDKSAALFPFEEIYRGISVGPSLAFFDCKDLQNADTVVRRDANENDVFDKETLDELSSSVFAVDHSAAYSEIDGRYTYVDVQSELAINSEKISYSSDSGIDIGLFLKYRVLERGYGIIDKVKASGEFADKVRELLPTAFCGLADLKLSDVYEEDGGNGAIVVKYSFFLQNIRINCEDVTVKIVNDKIVFAEIPLISFEKGSASYILLQSAVFAAAAIKNEQVSDFEKIKDKTLSAVVLEYDKSEDETEYKCSWKLIWN
ncbi:MAG: hypothetical protein J5922_00125 [Clostridia bacterium]|nr:hypothetical protein [Clostridia bacterium]